MHHITRPPLLNTIKAAIAHYMSPLSGRVFKFVQSCAAFVLMLSIVVWLFIESPLARFFNYNEMLFIAILVPAVCFSRWVRQCLPWLHQPGALKGMNVYGYFAMTAVYFLLTVTALVVSPEGRELVYALIKGMSFDWLVVGTLFMVFWGYSLCFFFIDMHTLTQTRLNAPKRSTKGLYGLVVVSLSVNTVLSLFAFYAWSPQMIGESCYSATIMVLCASMPAADVAIMQQFWFSICVLAALNWFGLFASFPRSHYQRNAQVSMNIAS